MNIKEAKERLLWLSNHLKDFKDMEYRYDFNFEDQDERFLSNEIRRCLDLIEDTRIAINYLEKEVIAEGPLVINIRGRFQVGDIELTAGNNIEIWDEKEGYWYKDKIEHFEGKYGLYITKTNEIEGLQARVRR